MLYVVAGNKNEFVHYMRTKCLEPTQTRYVSDSDTLRGMTELNGVFIGSAWARSDISIILANINLIRRRNKKPIITLDSIKPKPRTDEYNTTPHSGLIVAISTATTTSYFATINNVAQGYGSFVSLTQRNNTYYYKFSDTRQAATFKAFVNGSFYDDYEEPFNPTPEFEDQVKHFKTISGSMGTVSKDPWKDAGIIATTIAPSYASSATTIAPSYASSTTSIGTSAAIQQRFIVSVPYAPATSTTMLDKELFDTLSAAKTYGSYVTNTWNKNTNNYEFIFMNVSHAAAFSALNDGIVTIQ